MGILRNKFPFAMLGERLTRCGSSKEGRRNSTLTFIPRSACCWEQAIPIRLHTQCKMAGAGDSAVAVPLNGAAADVQEKGVDTAEYVAANLVSGTETAIQGSSSAKRCAAACIKE